MYYIQETGPDAYRHSIIMMNIILPSCGEIIMFTIFSYKFIGENQYSQHIIIIGLSDSYCCDFKQHP